MPFQKNNKYRISPGTCPMDKQPIGFKGWEGQREKRKSVQYLPNRLREFVDLLIQPEKPAIKGRGLKPKIIGQRTPNLLV